MSSFPIPLRPELTYLIPGSLVVIKVGSAGVTLTQGGIDTLAINNLARDLVQIKQLGLEVILVSSGAIQTGRQLFAAPPGAPMEQLQACSAVGQPLLMKAYDLALAGSGLFSAQVLLTHEDFRHPERRQNAQRTLRQLYRSRCIPILNENDTVSFDEISVGDNDQLAAMVAGLCGASLLIILTSPDGFYDKDPSSADAKVLPQWSPSVLIPQEGASKTQVGRGGIATKTKAVQMATQAGTNTLVASYRVASPIVRALYRSVGTWCPHQGDSR